METKENVLTLPSIFNETLQKYGKSPAYAFVGENPMNFETARKYIRSVSAFLQSAGVVKGDRVAILSMNMPNWAIAYFSITCMGAVVVPILPDFSVTEVANVLGHSGAKAIFISSGLLNRIEGAKPENLETGILIEDFSIIFSKKDSVRFDFDAVAEKEYVVEEEDLASIIYTSGTTGRSKGVMLTHKNICFNAKKGKVIQSMRDLLLQPQIPFQVQHQDQI